MNALFSKPFALSIGPQACGTDILYDYFQRQSGVVLPSVREVFFFDRHVQRGADFYIEHFEDRMDAQMFMELTTTAFDARRAPQRVKELLGQDVKLFCPLRDPVERALAVYDEYLRYGIVKGGFREACDQAPQILFASRYGDHLPLWLEQFDDIHFLTYESLLARFEQTMAALCNFIGLPVDSGALRKIKRKAWVSRLKKSFKPDCEIALDDQAWLKEQLAGEMDRVKNLLKKPLFSN